MKRHLESSVATDHAENYHGKFSFIYLKYYCNTTCITRKSRQNLKNKKIKSINAKVET